MQVKFFNLKWLIACIVLLTIFILLGVNCFLVNNIKTTIELKSLTFSDEKLKKEVTAYSARESETDSTPTITASGQKVRKGIIAVSRDLYSSGWTFGKKVIIPGVGIFEVQDKMGKSRKRGKKRIKQTNCLDIFMEDTSKAVLFGRQKLIAKLIK